MAERRTFLGVIFAWRRLVARVTVASGIAAVIVSLLLPRWYTAHATITPPDDSDMGGGLLQLVNQLGSGFGVGRARGLMNRTQGSDLVIGVLKSRRIRGEVVDRFDLVEDYDAKSREHAIKELGEHLQVGTTPEGLIDIAVEARGAERAAEMANAFVEFLDAYNRSTSVEDAKRTSQFIRTCLEENRTRMEDAAAALRRFQEERGAVELGEQTRATVEALAQLEAEKLQLQIQKGVLSNYATPNQFQVQEIEAKIREIEGKARELRRKTDPKGRPSDTALLALGDLPSLGLQFAQLKREVLVQEKVYEFLTAQLEDARIREARDMQTVKVLDEAAPPIRKSRPRRTLIVLLTVGLGFALSIGVAFAAEGFLGLEAHGGGPADPWLARLESGVQALRRWGGPVEPAG